MASLAAVTAPPVTTDASVRLYRLEEAAEILGYRTVRSVERFVHDGELRAVTLDKRRSRRIRSDDLQDFIDRRTPGHPRYGKPT